MRLPRQLPLLVAAAAIIASVALLLLRLLPQRDPTPDSTPAKVAAANSRGNALDDTPEQLFHAATAAFERKDFARAERLAEQVPSASSHSTAACRLAGEAAVFQEKFDAAIEHFDRMVDRSSSHWLDGTVLAGQVLLYRKHRLSEAEARFRLVLENAPDHAPANFAMYNLLSACGRRREMVPYLLKTMMQGPASLEHLYALSGEDSSYRAPSLLKQCYESDRECVGAIYGIALAAVNGGRADQAKELLQTAVRIRPDFAPAQALLGSVLLQEGAEAPFLKWRAQLTAAADENPDIWVLRGDWALRHNDQRAAVRCYWEAVRRDPNLRRPLYQLSVRLSAQEQHQPVQSFLLRSERLQSLKQLEARLSDEGLNSADMEQIVERMESLGRLWEAWGWCRVALQHDRSLPWAQRRRSELSARLEDRPPQTLASANPAVRVDLSDFPLPVWPASSANALRRVAADATTSAVSFEEIGTAAGFDFRYFSSPSLPGDGRKMYELTGGGVAVLDFDADGWPDLFLTQGCPWPPPSKNGRYLDRLFRNAADGKVVDVTEHAGVLEPGYSQGAAVGDFDNDGFDDILVGNIGKNRLFHNNGDGTFTDVSSEAGMRFEDWTTSCLIADINGDGLPDLYCVNYLQGDDVFRRVCRRADSLPRMCKPTAFEAAQDRLHLSLGGGQFQDATAEAGIVAAGGKGLGIVAADFDGSGSLSLFIANDTRPNFLFLNRTPRGGGRPVLIEQGYQTGLAFNGDGAAEGCMGIAVGDCDGDQRLDLFVTNFYAETNTLYLQADFAYRDGAQSSNLGAASLSMLGFGAQFLDADLDGNLDLVIANGHIDDLNDLGIPFQMPPQYFHNLGGGRFAPVSAENLGEYFQGRWLGRGLALLDFNRDGREDVAISHLDRRAALLLNTTPKSNHHLSLKLRGTQSSRDAIGAVATVEIAGRALTKQMTAGDGYQASNQRTMHFGLASAARIDRLNIRFPSGVEMQFEDVDGDRELLVVEGASEYYEIPH